MYALARSKMEPNAIAMFHLSGYYNACRGEERQVRSESAPVLALACMYIGTCTRHTHSNTRSLSKQEVPQSTCFYTPFSK